jgi:hypothetical protein
MHCLHAQNLVVALLVVEHGCSEIVKDVLGRKRPICLSEIMILVMLCAPYEPVSIRAK